MHFFVNIIPSFFMLSRKIYFSAEIHLANCTVPQIFAAFKEICQYYLHRGFCITTVNSDGEFAPLQALIVSLLGGPMINPETANKYVPEIKHKIMMTKERCQETQCCLPFQRTPKILMIHIVFQIVKLLNFLPT